MCWFPRLSGGEIRVHDRGEDESVFVLTDAKMSFKSWYSFISAETSCLCEICVEPVAGMLSQALEQSTRQTSVM